MLFHSGVVGGPLWGRSRGGEGGGRGGEGRGETECDKSWIR